MPSPASTPALASSRQPGLDTLRALAITMVFAYHYMVFVSGTPTFGWVSQVGWVGVDLFFVLSGYLIADPLVAGLARRRPLSLRSFYARRALRTLPVFWVVLAAYFLWPSVMGGRTPPALWRFLSFTQNIGLQAGTAFSHAWSLCIEEQFYLVLPLVLVAATRFGRARWQAWTLVGALVALGMGTRIVLWSLYGREADGDVNRYYTWVYYATLCRFDEFLPGIAVAMLKHLHRPLWERITAHGQAVLALGVAATLALLYGVHQHFYIDGYGYGFFMSAFGYSLVAMAFALLVVAALSPSSWLARLRVPGAYSLALWSYSTYLSHKPIAYVLQQQLKPLALAPGVLALLVTLASLAGGALLYKLVEAPFMALRGRWFPSTFADHPAPRAAAVTA